MQLVVCFALCLAALSKMNKFIDSIYYLHEKLNGIAKNVVSSTRSDSLQRHTNCEILTTKNKRHIWGIVNKVIYYSESTFDESVPIIKNGTSTYDLTTAGYLLKDLYYIKNGWIGLWRKLTTDTPWRVVEYNATFGVVNTYNLTCDQYTLQGKIYTYNYPYLWVTYSHQQESPYGTPSGFFFTKIDLRDSSIVYENMSEFQYYDGTIYTWFNRHVLLGTKLYFFDELSYNKIGAYDILNNSYGMEHHKVQYDGTYFYILYTYSATPATVAATPDCVVAKKVA